VVLQPKALHEHSPQIHCSSELSLSGLFRVSYSTMLYKFKLCKTEWLGSLPMLDQWRQDLSGSSVKISARRTENNYFFFTLLNDHFSTAKVANVSPIIRDIISHIFCNRFENSVQLKNCVYLHEHYFQLCIQYCIPLRSRRNYLVISLTQHYAPFKYNQSHSYHINNN
jgi:hypothetical protein